jgi:nucleoside-diphosphate-sugar epimerase
VVELAAKIWELLRPGTPFSYVSDDPFEHDVQRRVPAVDKARDVIGFEARTSLDDMLAIVVPWIRQAVHDGLI